MATVKQNRHISAREPPQIKPEPELPLQIKEEPELCIKQEPEEFPFDILTIKTEDNEDESPVLHQGPTEENRGETNGAEPDSEEHTDSSDTDHSEDYCPQQTPAKRSYAMIPPDSFVPDRRPFRRPDRRPFSCSHCGLSVRWRSELESHMVVHTGEKPFKCSLCEKSYTQKSTLNAHMKTHSGEKPHVCSVCEKRFAKISALNSHMKIHPFVCSVCDRRFHLNRSLKEHEQSDHHICPVCRARFPDDVELLAHLSTHNVARFHSDVEELTEDDGRQRSLAKRSQARIAPDDSEPEHRPFRRSSQKPLSCSHCGLRVRWKSELENHMMVHTGEKPFRCSFCDKSYSQKGSLNLHMKIHTNEYPYRCSDCDQLFYQTHALKEHQKSVHYICPVCESRFTDDLKLSAHLTTHQQKRTRGPSILTPFSCSDCGRSFRWKSHLQVHVSFGHRGVRPHRCPECGKSFGWKSHLEIHMSVHSAEIPHECLLCEKRFKNKAALLVHQRRAHDFCPLCKTCFPDETELDAHLRTHVEDGTVDPSFVENGLSKASNCADSGKIFTSYLLLKKHMSVHSRETLHKC
uniref:C2H2-type domain-containing protein n=1 Tax=Neogobius melanostomus TaxID=47308 RepID=A0A8C6SNK2_9GOBI